MPDSKVIGDVAIVVLVAAKAVYDVYGGKRRDRKHSDALAARFAAADMTEERRFAELRAEVREVRSFCVGPDGENGFRGDIREIKARVIGLEERERADLERRVGVLDRRSAP